MNGADIQNRKVRPWRSACVRSDHFGRTKELKRGNRVYMLMRIVNSNSTTARVEITSLNSHFAEI
jgi:hypothetical protein